MPVKRIFVNPAGQRDNLGDSVLRRAYLDALRDRGTLHVLVGKDMDYGSGLGLRKEDVAYASRSQWFIRAVGSALTRNLTFAANAGEVVGTSREMRRGQWQRVIARLAVLSGGDVIIAGVSVRPGTRVASTHLPQLARSASIVTCRDSFTRSDLGTGMVQPDWAFALGGGAPAEERRHLAVAFRGDRPSVGDGMVNSLRGYANRHGLTIWVVVQVRRDAAAAREMASRLDARLFDWPGHVDHAHHERALRKFYRTCRVVASDRIHALIIGATEGAMPIGIATSSPAKLLRTFDHLYALPVVDGTAEGASLLDLPAENSELIHAIAAARDQIATVRDRIAGLKSLRGL